MAKRAAKTEHVHKLQRHTYPNGTKIYFCILNCNYKIEAQFALGKETICHRCGVEFTMTEYATKLARPHCKSCGKMKVILPDGTAEFRQKNQPNPVMASVGKSSVESLKDRLSKVVIMASEEDRDI